MSDPIELRPIGKSASPAAAGAPALPPRHPATATSTSRTGAAIADALPGTLGSAYRNAEEKARAVVHLQEGGMDAVSVWGLALSAWFAFLALPLLLFPRILLFFSQVAPPSSSPLSPFSTASSASSRDVKDREEHYDTLTALESTLCLSLSLGLFAVALVSLIILVPTYELPNSNPSRKSLLGILVGLTTMSGLVLWNAGGIGGLSGVVGGGNIFVAVWGWWVVVFGGNGGSKLIKKDGKKSKTPERFKRL
ncbi:hypothetical protein IAU59_005842 [Kwoniella sp. CBS 9459]